FSSYQVKIAFVNGSKLAVLAQSYPSKPNLEQLLECISNSSEVAYKMKILSLMYKGPKGQNLAALKIQSVWKMYQQVKKFKELKLFLKTITKVQTFVRNCLRYKRTKEQIRKIEKSYLEDYKQI